MTRDQIISIARAAGFAVIDSPEPWNESLKLLEQFAALVAAAERERCAKVCDEVGNRDSDNHAYDAANAIRGLE